MFEGENEVFIGVMESEFTLLSWWIFCVFC